LEGGGGGWLVGGEVCIDGGVGLEIEDVLFFGMVRLVRLYGVEVGGCMGVEENIFRESLLLSTLKRWEKWMR